MSLGWTQILIVAVLVILLFGRGKIASLMGELAQGIKSFRKGMEEPPPDAAPLDAPKTEDTTTTEKTKASSHEEHSG